MTVLYNTDVNIPAVLKEYTWLGFTYATYRNKHMKQMY